MKFLSTLIALGVLLAINTTSVQATRFTTEGDKIYKNGSERFFILGVYAQNQPTWEPKRNHPDGWLELENHGFNTLNLFDPFPQPCGTSYTRNSYNVDFEGFISANSTNIPWLTSLGTRTVTAAQQLSMGWIPGTYGGPYNTPSGTDLSPNAREIMTHASDHGIYVIADQGPFTPDGARELDGSVKREYGVTGGCTSGTDVINTTMRETMVDNLTREDRWSAWGKDHENFLGWCALDEPLWHWQPNDRYAYSTDDIENRYDNIIKPIYDKIKRQDPDHLVFMNFAALLHESGVRVLKNGRLSS